MRSKRPHQQFLCASVFLSAAAFQKSLKTVKVVNNFDKTPKRARTRRFGDKANKMLNCIYNINEYLFNSIYAVGAYVCVERL